MTAAGQPSSDLVPLSERLLYLRVMRAVLVALVVLDAALLPQLLRTSFLVVASVSLGYLLVCLAIEGIWRLMRRPGLWLFGALLMLDGVYLAAATYTCGGSVGPVRYLVLVYLCAVTLLGSYRTGLKVALWQSLMQISVFYAQTSGLLASFGGAAATATEWYRLVAFIFALWALTFTTATLAAVNERELRRRRYEFEQLAQMGRDLENAEDPLSVGDVLLGALADTFAFRRMALFEVGEDTPRMLTSRGLLDAVVGDFRLGDKSVLRVVNDSRETLLVSEVDEVADPWLAAVMPAGRNLAVVPLVADGVVGVLVVETGPRPKVRIERRVIATIERYASHAALAIRNANLLARVQQMAVTDGLTELSNRRAFDRSLERELGRAARTEGRLSVVLLDIDHFKNLNDNHGHVVGDNVLRQIARALALCGREYDTVARYGGEEFAAVLPGCSSGLAMQVAERLRVAVEEAPSDVHVTASCGVATYPYDGIDVDSLLSAADRALYASKRAGRNQVRSAEQTRLDAAATG
ncbi:MAG TPA: GGDEF domain-containing protein [Mycobacteriales bacterium]|nr:GGDEF domain-containing protein [Mycobacteriales bacterium]